MARPSLLAQFRLLQAPPPPHVDREENSMADLPGAGRRATSSSPPLSPTTPQRCPRSESTENQTDQEAKRLKRYTTDVCKTNGLPDNALDDFLDVSINGF